MPCVFHYFNLLLIIIQAPPVGVSERLRSEPEHGVSDDPQRVVGRPAKFGEFMRRNGTCDLRLMSIKFLLLEAALASE